MIHCPDLVLPDGDARLTKSPQKSKIDSGTFKAFPGKPKSKSDEDDDEDDDEQSDNQKLQ